MCLANQKLVNLAARPIRICQYCKHFMQMLKPQPRSNGRKNKKSSLDMHVRFSLWELTDNNFLWRPVRLLTHFTFTVQKTNKNTKKQKQQQQRQKRPRTISGIGFNYRKQRHTAPTSFHIIHFKKHEILIYWEIKKWFMKKLSSLNSLGKNLIFNGD